MKLASVLRIAGVIACVCVLPGLAFAGACTTETVGSLLGTSCSIGDVQYSFFATGTFTGISASSLTFTPGGTLLDPEFTVTGPLSVTAGSGSSASLSFDFFWTATVIPSGLQIGSATNALFGAVVPGSPGSGFVNAGNNFGIPTFTNAIIQTGGPDMNSSSALIDSTSVPPFDGIFFGMSVTDGTVSLTSTSYQYDLVPTPEPSSLLLLGSGLLGLGFASKKTLTNCA